MSKVKQLTEKHPTMQALGDIFELMCEKGIKIDVDGNILVVHHENKTYRMLDLEKAYSSTCSGIYSIPPECEYKLCYEISESENVRKPMPLLCSCGEGDCDPGFLMCPECIERNNSDYPSLPLS